MDEIKEDIKKIKDKQSENSAMLLSISEQNKQITEFLAETNVLLKKSLGLLSSKFDCMFPLKDVEGLELIEQQLLTESKPEIVSMLILSVIPTDFFIN